MKRLLLLLAATAAAGIFTGTAAAAPTLTMNLGVLSASPGSTFTITGTLSNEVWPRGVWVPFYTDSECSLASWTGFEAGPVAAAQPSEQYTVAVTVPETMPFGTVWVQATTWGFGLTSTCQPLQIVPKPAPPPQISNIFLCYSTYQDQPGVWPEPEARKLLAAGYWYPYAVAGKVAGGTNLGSHHLTCNIAATQSVGDTFLGGDGTQLGAAYGGAFGIYPVVGS